MTATGPRRRRPTGAGRGGPRRVGEPLTQLLGSWGSPPPDMLASVFGAWEDIVGAAVAEQCRPVAVKGHTLIVSVSDAAWASELRWNSAMILDKINQIAGESRLDSLVVRVAPAKA